jgi:hypothetical protein
MRGDEVEQRRELVSEERKRAQMNETMQEERVWERSVRFVYALPANLGEVGKGWDRCSCQRSRLRTMMAYMCKETCGRGYVVADRRHQTTAPPKTMKKELGSLARR